MLTELRQRLATVDDPLTLLAGFFAYAPVGLQIYRADGHSLLVNDAFRALFGSEPPPEYNVLRDEIAQKNGVLDLIHRAFAGEIIRMPPTWYDPRQLKQVEISEGNRVAIGATFFPLFDAGGKVTHVAIAFADLTAEIDERERLAAILGQLPIGVIVANNSRFALVNDAAAAILPPLASDLPTDEVVRACNLREADGTPLVRLADMPSQRALRGEVIRNRELRLGDDRWLLVNGAPRRAADGSPVEGVSTLIEITERRESEEHIRRLSAIKDEFLGIASHELRTPLTAVRASVQVAVRRLAPKKDDPTIALAVDALHRAERQVDRMARLVEELLDGARIERGHLELSRRPVDLRDLVRRECEDAADTSQHELTLPNEPLTCNVDEGRIAQVLSNLLSNAARHGASETPKNEVRLERVDREARLHVRDFGPGIPEADLPTIFERFFRGGATHGTGGLGLGLYIAAEIARLHGGSLTVATSPGEGATFTLALPLDEP